MLKISDNLWNEIKNIFPEKNTKVGRRRHDAYLALCGIFYIMTTGAQWRNLPDYYGKPSTVHGWFMRWIDEGVFNKIFQISITKAIEKFGLPQCFITDTSSSKSPFARFGNINPTDRKKYGIKKGMVIDWNKIVLSIIIDAANKHDSKMLLSHLISIKQYVKDTPIPMLADSAFDVKNLRKQCAKNSIALHAATNKRRSKDKRIIRPKGRWRIEQIFGIQNWFRGIKFCWTKTKKAFLALCQFASLIHNFKLAGIFG